MNTTAQLAAQELAALHAVLAATPATSSLRGMFFSHMSRLGRADKPAVYRLLAKRGLIVRHPEAHRYTVGVWQLTERGLAVRPGEELSAVVG